MDSVIKSEFLFHGSEICHKTTQPTEQLILDRNKRLRQNPGVLRDFGKGQEGGTWGRLHARIPFIVYENAVRSGFDLNNRDSKIAAKEMARFLKTPMGRSCLVQGN